MNTQVAIQQNGKNPLNTMKWLLRREMWEHKGGVVWAPLIAGVITILILFAGFMFTGNAGSMVIEGETLSSLAKNLDPSEQQMFVQGLANNYIGFAIPVFMPLAFVVFFYSLFTLADERKDRSVLFWKSLPVGDGQTVASKALFALVVAPLVTIGLAMIVGLIGLFGVMIFGAFHGANLLGPVLSTPAVYMMPFQLLSMIPIYALWALPTVGWLMLVGAASPRTPFIWALLIPIMAGAMVSWFSMSVGINDGWFWKNIVGRMLLSVSPMSWIDMGEHVQSRGVPEGVVDGLSGAMSSASWALLQSPSMWIGAVAGVAMLVLASKVRGWKDEG